MASPSCVLLVFECSRAVQVLSISNIKLNDHAMEAIASALSSSPCLRELNVESNMFSSKGGMAIVSIVRR